MIFKGIQRSLRFTAGGLVASLLLTSHVVGQTAPVSLVTRVDVKQPRFRGRLYAPTRSSKRIGVVLIGGSEGHLYQADDTGPKLAALGYTVLGVDYHDGVDGPRKLADVPIETFTSAVEWLRSSGKVYPNRVVVLGDSRGSEAALLTGAYDQHVAGVIAYVPSFVVWGAVTSVDPKGPSAWTWRDRPLPFVPFVHGVPRGETLFTASLQNRAAVAAAGIPVERIRGPVLLVGSNADAVWPSGMMARKISAELREAKFRYPVTLLVFNHASHRLLGEGPSPVSQTYTYAGRSYTFQYGGTPEGTEHGRNVAWAALLKYLKAFS